MWANYAANGEPWLSWLGSALLHGACLLVILTGAIWVLRNDTQSVREFEPVIVPEKPDDEPGGGGGNPLGAIPNAPGRPTPPDLPKPVDVDNSKPLENLPKGDATVRPNAGPTIESNQDFVLKIPPKAPKMLGPTLIEALKHLSGPGKNGDGKGGGDGKGDGPGKGDSTGPGGASPRGQRVLRWELEFRFTSAAGFLQQLDALGCFVGFPDKNGKLMFIRNLKERPARPVYEDLKEMKRVYFVDQRSEVNDGVAEELNLDVVPSAIIAAMPRTMEDQLVAVETKFAGRKEEDIKRTRFLVTFSGGKANFKVVEQDPKPGCK